MSAPTIQMNEASHQILEELAKRTGQTVTEVLGNALDAYRRHVFFEQMNAGYAGLRADSDEWNAHLAERNLSDASLADGLDSGERWAEDGRCLTPEDRAR